MEEDWDNPSSQIFSAVGCNNVDLVRKCLDDKVDINAKDDQERTPLHIAVENRCGEIIRLLLMNGADVSALNASKTDPGDIALSKEYNDIHQMLYMVGTTNWRPGLDPELMLTPRPIESYMDSKAKSNLIFERSQISLKLQDENLEHHFPKFDTHSIDWLQFMRLDDECLQEIGISEPEDRKKILRLIHDASDRKWQGTSVLPSCMQKDFTSYEATCILKNLHTHTQVILSRVNELKAKVEGSPEMLRQDMEAVPIENLSSAVEQSNEMVNVFTESIQDLSNSVLGKKGAKKNKPSHGISSVTYVGLFAASVLLGTALWIRLRRKF